MVRNKNRKQQSRGNGQKKNYRHSRKDKHFRAKAEKQKLGENYRFVKKMKNIQRNTENEEMLRKRQKIEGRSQRRNEEFRDNAEESSEEEDTDYYSKVLTMFNVPRKTGKAIETSSEEDGESSDEGEEESEGSEDESPPKKQMKREESGVKPEAVEATEELPEVEDAESEGEDEEQSIGDPYSRHLDHNLSPDLYEAVSKEGETTDNEQKVCSWPNLGRLMINIPKTAKSAPKKKLLLLEEEEKFAEEGRIPERIPKEANLDELHVKSQLSKNLLELTKDTQNEPWTGLQSEIFSIINNYQDLYMPGRTFENCDEIRSTYSLHALNHVLKSYTKVSQGKRNESRDQGFTRPKVLIILPFKNSALLVINTLISLLVPNSPSRVVNHKRFLEEFTGDELHFPRNNPKPEDYEKTFCGNTDDNFRIGISVTKKSVKLYADFYSADFIIASPLGLRMIVGADGEEERDYDFLSSIEMLIIDQMDVILTQNWLHLLDIFDHLHLKLQTRKHTDFFRVRSWCLNGWSRFYRQTLLFSHNDLPEFTSLLCGQCRNYRGSVRVANPITVGSIQQVSLQIDQVFHRIEVKSLEVAHDERFDYFITTILPRFKPSFMAHCLIYVPSYFDFVRLRNHFRKESISFVQVCEYTEDAKIARARDMFFHSGAHFMLYTGRAHFYRRTRIKGIRHIIMYQPPLWGHFYPELVNLMHSYYQNPRDGLGLNASVTVLYTKYDSLQTAAILGTQRTSEMLQSSKLTHTIVKKNQKKE